FEGVSDFGNNLFLDDIQFKNNTYVGEREYEEALSVAVYPNPAQGQTQIEFPLAGDADVSLELTDVAGKTVLQQNFRDQKQGSFRHKLDLSDLPAGVYSLKVQADGAQHLQKLIVQ
ncbi:MAG: T9SS type A sorting domain-containing protein, partial [Schleiferiaceae bacterium]|nr:T9SS type A sorting domain-containing protein [Schleiferiaceae bacterium]